MPATLAVNFPLVSLAVLVVTLRLIVKWKLRKLAIEDALIVFSTLVTISLVGLTVAAKEHGFGMHIWDVPVDWWPMFTTYSYTMIALSSTCFPVTKLSMLFFYLRLATLPTPRKIIYATITIVTVTCTATTLVTIFQCRPIRAAWHHDPNAKCVDMVPIYHIGAPLNLITEVLMVAIPIPIIMKMHLQRGVKLGLIAMFAAGVLIASISAFSVYAMFASYRSKDATWDAMYSWTWALAEYSTGIIVACMPSMLLFLRWVRGDMDGNKKPISGSNPTIGGGGVRGRPARGTETSEMHTRISMVHEDDEYGMRDEGGIMKSKELVIVETASDREGSMC